MEPSPRRANSRRDDFRKLRSRARMWSVSTWLIVLCVAVHFIRGLFRDLLPGGGSWGWFSVETTLAQAQLWRVLTFQFMHGGLLHLGLNCAGLWIFGPMVERKLGRARTLAMYLLCGVGGAAGFTLLWAAGLFSATATTPLIGASAGVFGMIAAAMSLVPNRILNLLFPPIDITVFRFGLVYLGVAVFVVVAYGGSTQSNAGGEAAHLGGAAIGYLLAGHAALLNWADRLVPRALRSPGHRSAPKDIKAPSYMKYHGWR